MHSMNESFLVIICVKHYLFISVDRQTFMIPSTCMKIINYVKKLCTAYYSASA